MIGARCGRVDDCNSCPLLVHGASVVSAVSSTVLFWVSSLTTDCSSTLNFSVWSEVTHFPPLSLPHHLATMADTARPMSALALPDRQILADPLKGTALFDFTGEPGFGELTFKKGRWGW